MRPMVCLPCSCLLDGAEGQPADELALAEPAEHQDRRDGERRGCRKLGPEQALRARIGRDEDGERCRLEVERLSVQNASFQARITLSSSVEAMPGTAIGVST